jgi:hypothetical protein
MSVVVELVLLGLGSPSLYVPSLYVLEYVLKAVSWSVKFKVVLKSSRDSVRVEWKEGGRYLRSKRVRRKGGKE